MLRKTLLVVLGMVSTPVLTSTAWAYSTEVFYEPPGWQKVTDHAPFFPVPLNGYINLGLKWVGGCEEADASLGTLTVSATRLSDGQSVAGSLVFEHLDGMVAWQPAEAMQPDTNYAVTVTTPDLRALCGAEYGAKTAGGMFTTGPTAATGAPRVDVKEIPRCGGTDTAFRLTSPSDPYVTFTAYRVDAPAPDVRVAPETLYHWMTLSGAVGGSECVEVIASDVVTGETSTARVCRSPEQDPPSSCPSEVSGGCVAGSTLPGVPVLTVIAGLLLVAMRRRRDSAHVVKSSPSSSL